MTGLPLPALDGRTPLGFLGALGVLRLVAEHTDHPTARLAFSRQDCTAVLHSAHANLDTLVTDLSAIIDTIPDGGVIPHVAVDFPPPGEAPDRLRLTRPAFRQYAHQATNGSSAVERWLGMLVTDLSVDDKDRIDITPYAAPSGKQSTRTMFEKSLIEVRKDKARLHEALTGWRRYPGVTGEYLDHRVLFDAVDAPDGKSAERGVPGATWLALMAYPLLRTTAPDREPLSTCWQDFGHPTGRRLVYPLWSCPLDTPAVQAVLAHPVLNRAEPGTPPPAAALLSVFWVVHAARRRIPGRNFAGVLAPANDPARPTMPSRARTAAR